MTNNLDEGVDVDESTQTKVCPRCLATKPFSEFYALSSSRDGRGYSCKPCLAQRRRERRALTDADRAAEAERKAVARQARLESPNKVCPRCLVEKPKTEFYKATRQPDGLQIHCKQCHGEENLESRRRNPELYRKMSREALSRRRAERPEELAAYMRRWRAENAERLREEKRKWIAAMTEEQRAKRRESQRQWKIRNPEAQKLADLLRRARKRGATVGDINLGALWKAQGGICGLCCEPIDRAIKWPDPRSPSIDHIIPLALGGSHAQENLQWACLGCNLAKGARVPD